MGSLALSSAIQGLTSFKFKIIRSFLVRSPKDGELLGLEWGIIRQVSNTIFPDQNSFVRCQYSKGSDTM